MPFGAQVGLILSLCSLWFWIIEWYRIGGPYLKYGSSWDRVHGLYATTRCNLGLHLLFSFERGSIDTVSMHFEGVRSRIDLCLSLLLQNVNNNRTCRYNFIWHDTNLSIYFVMNVATLWTTLKVTAPRTEPLTSWFWDDHVYHCATAKFKQVYIFPTVSATPCCCVLIQYFLQSSSAPNVLELRVFMKQNSRRKG